MGIHGYCDERFARVREEFARDETSQGLSVPAFFSLNWEVLLSQRSGLNRGIRTGRQHQY